MAGSSRAPCDEGVAGGDRNYPACAAGTLPSQETSEDPQQVWMGSEQEASRALVQRTVQVLGSGG